VIKTPDPGDQRRSRRYINHYKKGVKAELELAYKLWKRGYFVMRGPGSGKRLKRIFYPDLLAIKNGRILIFEVKLRKHRDTIHFEDWKIRIYRELARRSGGECYVAVKITDERRWFFFRLDELKQQQHENKKRYVIDVGMYEKATPEYTIII